MRRLAFVLALAAVLAPLRAEAISLRDIIELTRAGLSDEVLLALIEVDQPVFSTDAETLKKLKAAGVSERVIVAMVRSGRTPVPPPAVPEPVAAPEAQGRAEPQVIVIEHREPETRVREVPVAVPVYVPVVPIRPRVHDGAAEPKPQEPVYWGWGGKRRPDAWQDPKPETKPAKKPH